MFGLPMNEMNFRNRRGPLKPKTSHTWSGYSRLRKACGHGLVAVLLAGFLLAPSAEAQTQVPQTQVPQTQGPVRVTLDEAIQLALQHNHNILAARTTIQQSQAEETTANLRPNPYLFADWEYLPLFSPSSQNSEYLRDSAEADLGLGYLIERGKKRQHRLQAAKDITAQTISLVADNERGLTFNVASLFVNVQLAESTLELAEKDLKSFGQTVAISEMSYKAGDRK